MIEKKELFGFNHYFYGEAYFGSFRGMRFRLAREPLARVKTDKVDPDARFLATVWEEPWSYGSTRPEDMTSEEFPFTDEGMDEAVKWLNDRYSSDPERWKAAAERGI